MSDNEPKGTIEERVKQLEKDVQGISFTLSELLTWKRNQVTRQLPETPHKKKI